MIDELIATGKEFGIFQFYLPFVLSYAIIYGILAKINIFGKEKTGKNINLLVSGILSLLLIGWTPVGITLAEYFGTMFTGTILVIVTLLGSIMILYVLGMLIGIELPLTGMTAKGKRGWAVLLLLIAMLLAVGVFLSSGGRALFPGLTFPGVTIPEIPIPAIPAIGLNMTQIAIIVMFLGTAGIIWWMQQEEKKPKPKAPGT